MKPTISVGVVLLAAAESALAQAQLYFGRDLGLGETTPLVVPAQTPNSWSARNAFVGAIGAYGTQDFEAVPLVQAPVVVPIPGISGLTLTLLDDVASNGYIASLPAGATDGFGRYPTSGNRFWNLAVETAGISFSQPVQAVGFFSTDMFDLSPSLSFRLTFVGGGTQVLSPGSVGSVGGTACFLGFKSSGAGITRLTFLGDGLFDGFGVDDIVVSVPAPATLGWMLAILAPAGILRQRRSR